MISSRLRRWFYRSLGRQISFPTNDLTGRLMRRVIESQHTFLAKCAVKLLGIGPHERVLELGCGTGVGLKCAYWRVEEGEGKIFGTDASHRNVKLAKLKCAKEIEKDKIQIHASRLTHLPFLDAHFHAAFHCNSVYFWPDLSLTLKELYRTLRPGGRLVSTVYVDDGLDKMAKGGQLDDIMYNRDPLAYLTALEAVGFEGVKVRYMTIATPLLSAEEGSERGQEVKQYRAVTAVKPVTAKSLEKGSWEVTEGEEKWLEDQFDKSIKIRREVFKALSEGKEGVMKRKTRSAVGDLEGSGYRGGTGETPGSKES